MENIAVDGAELELESGSGTITIDGGQTSSKVKFDGKGAYKTLKFSISGYQGGEITNSDGTGSGEIIAGSTKVKIEGNAAFLEGDMSATITITGTTTVGPVTTTVTTPDVVKISSAGQSKVKAE